MFKDSGLVNTISIRKILFIHTQKQESDHYYCHPPEVPCSLNPVVGTLIDEFRT